MYYYYHHPTLMLHPQVKIVGSCWYVSMSVESKLWSGLPKSENFQTQAS